MADLKQKRIAILVDNGFEEAELASPKEAFEQAGAKVDIVSPQPEKVRSWVYTDWGKDYPVDVQLDNAVAENYDALILPGGTINPDLLRVNDKALAFIQKFIDTDKIIGSICHGPWTLAEIGYVKGKKVTSYKAIVTDLKNAGAVWVDEPVVQDGNLITSRTPDDLEAFNAKLLDEVAKS